MIRLTSRTVKTAVSLLLVLIMVLNTIRMRTDPGDNGLDPSQHRPLQTLSPHYRHLSNYPVVPVKLPNKFKVIEIQAEGADNVNRTASWGIADPFNCTTSKTSPPFVVCLFANEEDKYISSSLRSSGMWDPPITKVLQTALDRHPLATLLDVGANLGFYTLLAAAMGHRVVAIEPQPRNIRRLVGGASRSHWRENVLLLANALSDTPHRNVSLSSNKDNQGGVRVEECPHWSWHGVGGATPDTDRQRGVACHVTTITLDDLVPLIASDDVILKIDIEGTECRALETSAKFFSSLHVPYLLMEWRPMTDHMHDDVTPCPPGHVARLGAKMAALGYVPHEIHSGIQLNPLKAAKWRVNDIYWRKEGLDLLVPSL